MTEEMRGYCMKCKTKREISEAEATFTKSGVPATKGKCPECGTTIFVMGETPAHEGLPRPEVVKKPKSKKKAKKSVAPKRSRKKIENLVIVESPAKARSIGSYLGNDYTVLASKGHVRDLLVTQLSVDVDNDFEPKYRVPNDKRATVKQIKDAVDSAKNVFLATDPDREGEAIAWHLAEAIDIDETAKRVTFNEVTRDAVRESFEHARNINMDLVNAQQARRILDRLVGYNITELLWDKVRNRLSAGRVQSIALRLVVEREREIDEFVTEEYWSIDAELAKQTINGHAPEQFTASLAKINGNDVKLSTQEAVDPHVAVLEKSQYVVSNVRIGTRRRKPSAPFTTSTLQQEASRRLGFDAHRTMRAAQSLYEGIELANGEIVGLITYMRTDSVNIAKQAQDEALDYITTNFGKEYAPEKPHMYKTRSKAAQEAHEAIRPTSVVRTPLELRSALKSAGRDLFKLYQLIWERFVASQMAYAVYDTVRAEIKAGLTAKDMPYLFRASGNRIRFKGFLAVYEESRDEDVPDATPDSMLPELHEDEDLNLLNVIPLQHFTQPPPRYTEASLVRTLEENGIGRPSTYAPTVAVIQDRDYVTKEDKRLVPTETGKVVSKLLVDFFDEEMDYQFTAKLEDQLDEIAQGDVQWVPFMHDFYEPFVERLKNARTNMPKMKQEELVGRTCPTCGDGDLVIKYGRWGKFIGCSNYPECRHTEQYQELIGVACPVCGEEHGGEVVELKTRRGRTFYGCTRYPECEYRSWNKPGTEDDQETSDEQSLQEEAS
ncbi:MAG: type I DNA topoisomerase [Anaerolineaceae bacterium]|nr:type I DNA topoisomerase [Anaerolineaceae bacterium]